MPTLRRIVVAWTGLTGLPGVSVFYAPSATDAGANIKTFLTANVASFPVPLTWSVPTSGDTIDDTTGTINGGWTGGTGGTVTATANVAYAAGVGAYVNWGTTGIINGRRLKGRTFMAPLITSGYDTSGTIASGTLTAMQTAATTLAASLNLVIWHRPTTPGGSDGESQAVSSALVPDQVTSLRTRRR